MALLFGGRRLLNSPKRRFPARAVLLESPSAHRIKITDFGFSKDFLNDSLPKTKRVGTLAYMAPEV